MENRFLFKFHGAAKEVGRSCIEICATGPEGPARILLDAGLKITEDREFFDDYPTEIDRPDEIDAVFLSHAHLDHTGALPFLNHMGLECPILCNSLTKEVAKLLLMDSLKIELLEKHSSVYNKNNITRVMDLIRPISMYQKDHIKGIWYKFYDAGHIPGSTCIVLEINGKRILYTGDVNHIETNLLHGSNEKFNNIDIMICESTYGDREHPNRESEEKRFLDTIQRTIEDGGSVLVPAFAVGRAQEVLMMLSKRHFGVPIYLDGMAKKVTKLYMQNGASLKDASALEKAWSGAIPIGGWQDRKEVVKQQAIIVTTSGMMDGGPVIEYARHHYFETKNLIVLTGYQAEGCNGRMLLEEGTLKLNEDVVKVRCKVEKFDFSAHSGCAQLKTMIKNIKPKVLILQHGEEKSIKNLASWCDFSEVHTPDIDEEIEVIM